MRKRSQSTDGFMIPRRPQATSSSRRLGVDNLQVPHQFIAEASKAEPKPTTLPPPHLEGPKMSKKELDESLKSLDDDVSKPKKRRLLPKRKVIKRVIIALVILLVLIGGYLGIKAFLAGSQIFQGNVFELLGQGQPLTMDENGRSNILIF